MALVDVLIASGASIDTGDVNGWTPLMVAVSHASGSDRHRAIVKILINVSAQNNKGQTAWQSVPLQPPSRRKEILAWLHAAGAVFAENLSSEAGIFNITNRYQGTVEKVARTVTGKQDHQFGDFTKQAFSAVSSKVSDLFSSSSGNHQPRLSLSPTHPLSRFCFISTPTHPQSVLIA